MRTTGPGRDVIGLSASEVHVLKIAAGARRGALIDHVAAEAGLSRNAAQVRLRGLKNQGLLEVRSMRFGGFVKYRITERGRKALAQLARTSK